MTEEEKEKAKERDEEERIQSQINARSLEVAGDRGI